MNLEEIKQLVNSDKYSFLRDEPRLKDNIILLTLGGSYAYGTNNEDSDLDVRGIALNSKEDILTNSNFNQFINNETDTTIYSFNKIITLLTNCNPNTIEILGCNKEHYLHVSDIGQELLDNSDLFLSKLAIHSFGGYANQQLRRLTNKSKRDVSHSEREQHILNTLNNAKYYFKDRYFSNDDDNINLYIGESAQEEYDTEIFMDVNFKNYPLRDYKSMMSEMQSIVKEYGVLGKRNENAAKHDKLGKHMCHLLRLYIMCLDILEKQKIVTYRDAEHDLLMDIRNGKYLDDNKQVVTEFFDIIADYEQKLEYAKKNTELSDKPDYKKIRDFTMSVNERIVVGNIKNNKGVKV